MAAKKYIQILPAEPGWFAVTRNQRDGRLVVALRIAGWGLTKEGKIYGLVPSPDGLDDGLDSETSYEFNPADVPQSLKTLNPL